MKKITIYIVMAMLCCFFNANAQNHKKEIKTLDIGDIIPESVWNMPLNVTNHLEGKETIKLKDYKDKLIILDFWATYCTPCVASISNLDTLQNQFTDEIAVFTVHLFDFPDKVLPYMQKKKWRLPCILGEGDSLLNKLFFVKPRFGEVWIKDGKLLAIPIHKAVNSILIQKVLQNQNMNIPMDDYLTIFEKRKNIIPEKLK